MSSRLAMVAIAIGSTLLADSAPDGRTAEATRLVLEGRFADAAELYRTAYQEAVQSGVEDKRLAEAAAALGSIYTSLDRYAEAEPLLHRALDLDRRLLAPDAPETVRHSVALAKLYAMQNRLVEAGEILARVRPTVQRDYGGDSQMMGSLWNDLGLIEEGFGRPAQAAVYYRQAIAIYAQKGESRRGPMAMVMINLAAVLADDDRLEEAEQTSRAALSLIEHIFGPHHPFTGRALHSLGRVLQASNHVDEARALYERALNDCPTIGVLEGASIQASLGSAYSTLGYFSKAETLLRQGLAAREHVLGSDNVELVSVLNNLGALYSNQHRYTDAIRVLERGVSIADRSRQNPVLVVPLLCNLGATYFWDGESRKSRYGQAEATFRRVVAMQEERFGPDHPQVANALVSLAAACAAEKNYREAKQVEGRAVAIRRAVLGPKHPDTVLAMKQYSFFARKSE